MTETSGPFKAAASGDQWQETDWGNMMKRLFRDGVFSGYLNELEVVEHTPAAGMYADVKTGGGWVQGHIHANSALKAMTIDAAHATLDRTDRIVLRRTYASPNSEIALAVLKGVDMAAGTSTPTALTQDATTWEISLATVLVAAAVTAIYTADITDERRSAYCGIAAATLGDFAIDTSGNLDGNGMKIVDLADPTTDQDAATKKYVDDQIGTFVEYTVLTSGSGTHTTNAKTTKLLLKMIGGGGGSGGAKHANGAISPHGGTGAYLEVFLSVSPSTGYAYSVGAAGAAGDATPTDGGDGGDSTFVVGATTYTAGGGKGGLKSTADCSSGVYTLTGGAGGTATNGDLNISGLQSLEGGHWIFARLFPLLPAPFGGSTYGFGGKRGTGDGEVGFAGGPGLIIIEEYT